MKLSAQTNAVQSSSSTTVPVPGDDAARMEHERVAASSPLTTAGQEPESYNQLRRRQRRERQALKLLDRPAKTGQERSPEFMALCATQAEERRRFAATRGRLGPATGDSRLAESTSTRTMRAADVRPPSSHLLAVDAPSASVITSPRLCIPSHSNTHAPEIVPTSPPQLAAGATITSLSVAAAPRPPSPLPAVGGSTPEAVLPAPVPAPHSRRVVALPAPIPEAALPVHVPAAHSRRVVALPVPVPEAALAAPVPAAHSRRVVAAAPSRTTASTSAVGDGLILRLTASLQLPLELQTPSSHPAVVERRLFCSRISKTLSTTALLERLAMMDIPATEPHVLSNGVLEFSVSCWTEALVSALDRGFVVGLNVNGRRSFIGLADDCISGNSAISVICGLWAESDVMNEHFAQIVTRAAKAATPLHIEAVLDRRHFPWTRVRCRTKDMLLAFLNLAKHAVSTASEEWPRLLHPLSVREYVGRCRRESTHGDNVRTVTIGSVPRLSDEICVALSSRSRLLHARRPFGHFAKSRVPFVALHYASTECAAAACRSGSRAVLLPSGAWLRMSRCSAPPTATSLQTLAAADSHVVTAAGSTTVATDTPLPHSASANVIPATVRALAISASRTERAKKVTSRPPASPLFTARSPAESLTAPSEDPANASGPEPTRSTATSEDPAESLTASSVTATCPASPRVVVALETPTQDRRAASERRSPPLALTPSAALLSAVRPSPSSPPRRIAAPDPMFHSLLRPLMDSSAPPGSTLGGPFLNRSELFQLALAGLLLRICCRSAGKTPCTCSASRICDKYKCALERFDSHPRAMGVAPNTLMVKRTLATGLFRAKPCAKVQDGCRCSSPPGLCNIAIAALSAFFPDATPAILPRPDSERARHLPWATQSRLAEITCAVVSTLQRSQDAVEVKDGEPRIAVNVYGLSLDDIFLLAEAQLAFFPTCAKGSPACRCATATQDMPCALVGTRLVESFSLAPHASPTLGWPAVLAAVSAGFITPLRCGEGAPPPGCACLCDPGNCPIWSEAVRGTLVSGGSDFTLSPSTTSAHVAPVEPPHLALADDPASSASPTRWAPWDERAEKAAAVRSATSLGSLPVSLMSATAPAAAGTLAALFASSLGYARRCALALAVDGCLCASDHAHCPTLKTRLASHVRNEALIPGNFAEEILLLLRIQIIAPVRCHARTPRSNCTCSLPISASSPLCPKWLARLDAKLSTLRAAQLTASAASAKRRSRKGIRAASSPTVLVADHQVQQPEAIVAGKAVVSSTSDLRVSWADLAEADEADSCTGAPCKAMAPPELKVPADVAEDIAFLHTPDIDLIEAPLSPDTAALLHLAGEEAESLRTPTRPLALGTLAPPSASPEDASRASALSATTPVKFTHIANSSAALSSRDRLDA